MEVRLQPRSDGEQRCLSFTLEVDPAANVMQYTDFLGNMVHHFDIAGSHSLVKVTAESAVEVESSPLPSPANSGDWSDLDALVASGDYWEMLLPSHFTHSSPILDHLARELKCERRDNPLALVTELNARIYRLFAYVPNSTKVDSPIEEALAARQGVCQDFAFARRCVARLGGGADSALGMGRFRSHQQSYRCRPSHPRCYRMRLRRRSTNPGRIQGRSGK
jgi:transglutaminase-like putative cysteine protease